MIGQFPCPAEHAVSLIETCRGAGAAFEVTQINIACATTDKDYRYWSMVGTAILELSACQN